MAREADCVMSRPSQARAAPTTNQEGSQVAFPFSREYRPRLSVVTATRNRVDLLSRSIESVARQTYPDKEHIIVDGDSTDGTVEFL